MRQADYIYGVVPHRGEYGFEVQPDHRNPAVLKRVQSLTSSFQWNATTNDDVVAIAVDRNVPPLVARIATDPRDPSGRASLCIHVWITSHIEPVNQIVKQVWPESVSLPIAQVEFVAVLERQSSGRIIAGPRDSFVAVGFDQAWGVQAPKPLSSTASRRPAESSTFSKNTTANSHTAADNRRLLVMSGIGLIALALLWLMVPPLSDFFSNKGSAKNDGGNDDIPTLISKQWNLTKDKAFTGEDHLLKLVDPLVAPSPRKSNRDRLVHVLESVNQVRLGNIADSNKTEPESVDKALRTLLCDGALNSYICKLVSSDGTVDRFGQVADNIGLVALKQLLPASVDGETASNYRRLARQLRDVVPIGPQGKNLLDEVDPFFDFAEQWRNDFERMVQSFPKSLSDAPSDCTFFTEDDCIAAREVTSYFKSIGYLENGLGFPLDDPRRVRLVTNYSSRPIVCVLNDWKAFTDENLTDPHQNQKHSRQSTMKETP